MRSADRRRRRRVGGVRGAVGHVADLRRGAGGPHPGRRRPVRPVHRAVPPVRRRAPGAARPRTDRAAPAAPDGRARGRHPLRTGDRRGRHGRRLVRRHRPRRPADVPRRGRRQRPRRGRRGDDDADPHGGAHPRRRRDDPARRADAHVGDVAARPARLRHRAARRGRPGARGDRLRDGGPPSCPRAPARRRGPRADRWPPLGPRHRPGGQAGGVCAVPRRGEPRGLHRRADRAARHRDRHLGRPAGRARARRRRARPPAPSPTGCWPRARQWGPPRTTWLSSSPAAPPDLRPADLRPRPLVRWRRGGTCRPRRPRGPGPRDRRWRRRP